MFLHCLAYLFAVVLLRAKFKVLFQKAFIFLSVNRNIYFLSHYLVSDRWYIFVIWLSTNVYQVLNQFLMYRIKIEKETIEQKSNVRNAII